MLTREVTNCHVVGRVATTPLELMSTAVGNPREHMTPVQAGEQGSEPETQLLRLEGQELAVRRMPYIAVVATGGGGGGEGGRGGGEGGAGQGEPIPLLVAKTTEESQGEGMAPQRPPLPGPSVRADIRVILEAHAAGRVEKRLFDARSIRVKDVREDQAAGRVLERALDCRLRLTSLDKVDQDAGRMPVIELPSNESEVKEVIQRISEGRGTPEMLM